MLRTDPVEAAFEEERTAGVAGALVAGLQLGLEAGELVGGEVAAAGVDQRAGGAGGVVEQRLVPARGCVVDVDCRGGGLDGREAVVVVGGVEQLEMQHAGDAGDGLAGEDVL